VVEFDKATYKKWRQYVVQILLSHNPDLAPSDLHLFGPRNQHLEGRRFHNNEEVEMAVREWLRTQKLDFYRDEVFKFLPGWDKCVNVLGDYVEK
jgi:hypothetical protein